MFKWRYIQRNSEKKKKLISKESNSNDSSRYSENTKKESKIEESSHYEDTLKDSMKKLRYQFSLKNINNQFQSNIRESHKGNIISSNDDEIVVVNDAKTCVVCMDKDVNAILIPCGHLGLCIECAKEIDSNSGFCPICRQKIESFMRVYLV